MNNRYKDIYGDIWLRVSEDHVKRERDGNLGGWFHGDGLVAA